MPARAMWKGVIQLEDEEVPVKLYAAMEDRAVHFRLLHRADNEPVKQRMVDAETGREVESPDIRKGAEIQRGVYVLLEEEELDELNPEPSRTIAVEGLVARDVIGHPWYDRPYFLGPDGDDGAYWGLVAALEKAGAEAVVRWVMRNKEYIGALVVHAGYLAIITLRFADQVIEAQEIELPEHQDLNPSEVKMAGQLISMLESPYKPEEYRDEFRDKVLELIAAKARGGTVKKARFKRRPEPESLTGALKSSIAALRKRKYA